ncbi:MAG: hypothetical protein ABSC87_03780 [Halobacteriota archaeon]|jgi:hypothetical protein
MDLPDDVMALLNDRDAVKTLATIAENGSTSLVAVKAVRAPEPSIIVFAQTVAKQLDSELLRHMDTGSLVSILCVSERGELQIAYQIICSVKEFQTTGPLYEKFLDELRARTVDLDGAWVLEPVDVIDRSASFGPGSRAT